MSKIKVGDTIQIQLEDNDAYYNVYGAYDGNGMMLVTESTHAIGHRWPLARYMDKIVDGTLTRWFLNLAA